jgi:hypothetical protein
VAFENSGRRAEILHIEGNPVVGLDRQGLCRCGKGSRRSWLSGRCRCTFLTPAKGQEPPDLIPLGEGGSTSLPHRA